ncbi:hypothetical protein HYV11_02625 [Candidatus Dependentiae bacterium]|nr:hypothetical protein [Candidatus Dependentiae bacterium]
MEKHTNLSEPLLCAAHEKLHDYEKKYADKPVTLAEKKEAIEELPFIFFTGVSKDLLPITSHEENLDAILYRKKAQEYLEEPIMGKNPLSKATIDSIITEASKPAAF